MTTQTLPQIVDKRFLDWLPNTLIKDPMLSDGAFRLWCVMRLDFIAHFLNKSSDSYFNVMCYYRSYKQLGEALEEWSEKKQAFKPRSDKTIQRYVANLVSLGYLFVFVNGKKQANNLIPVHPLDNWFPRIQGAYLKVKESRDFRAGQIDVRTEKALNPEPTESIAKATNKSQTIDLHQDFKEWANSAFGGCKVLISGDTANLPDIEFQYITEEEKEHCFDVFGLLIVDAPEWGEIAGVSGKMES
ncbi:hypothetical protein ACE25B_000748 [Vibrio parahaemolyticus]|uniref:hypothetical protein n=1 Tax=Vibrio parahaemolyticus TaxID=670 RepID=UPI00084A9597|nr:hypothetical protein [Vibrio parahaemolyticus]OEA68642.1 hypothetical protein BBM67_19460 [Vibrio parahaemolyticus]OEA76261.1 hypothetical protein BBM68_08695 [Vibrio parahaemolyticus]